MAMSGPTAPALAALAVQVLQRQVCEATRQVPPLSQMSRQVSQVIGLPQLSVMVPHSALPHSVVTVQPQVLAFIPPPPQV